MENYYEAISPLYIEHLDIATSNHLTEENTDHLEASDSNLSCSQDSYMRDINQGNILHSHIELDSPKTQCPKSNPQHDLPYSTTTTSIPVPTCSYSPRNSPQLPFEINPSPTSSYTQLNSFSHSSHPLDSEEPKCTVCMESCSQAHHCPGCHNAVHTVCGIQVAGCEGYGAPV